MDSLRTLSPRELFTTVPAHRNLSQLYSRPGFPLGFDKVTVLRVLRGLEGRGLIERAPAPTSRRNLAISLSVAGLDLLKQAQEPAELAYGRLMGPLNTEQRAQLVQLLQLLTEGLEADARAAFVPPAAETG